MKLHHKKQILNRLVIAKGALDRLDADCKNMIRRESSKVDRDFQILSKNLHDIRLFMEKQ